MDSVTAFIVSLTALVTAIASLLVALIKAKKEIENSIPKKIKNQCNIDNEIIKRMEGLKEYLNADRVQVYDFHNGGHYANGRSALKTSCTYEVCRNGCRSYQMYLQSIPLSCIPQFIETLLNKEELKIDNLEDIKECMTSTYHLKKDQGVKCFYDIIIHNKNKEPIGFLAIQYLTENNVTFNKDEKNEILKLKFFIEENLEKMTAKKSK